MVYGDFRGIASDKELPDKAFSIVKINNMNNFKADLLQ